MDLAPVVVIAYNRLDHFKRTVASLKANTLAQQSDLFVFIDGPKPGDEDEVESVADFAKAISGFKSLKVIQRPVNIYPNNIFESITEVLNSHGKIIFSEDDNECAPGFLQFMNDGLDFFRNDQKVISLHGYKRPLKTTPEDDYYAFNRFNPWGFATWKRKFDKSLMEYSWEAYKENKRLFRSISLTGRNIVLGTDRGWLKGWDVNITMNMIVQKKLAIYPKRSLVRNIGNDGTGVNSNFSSTRFDVSELWEKQRDFHFDNVDKVNSEILSEIRHIDKRIMIRPVVVRLAMVLRLYPILVKFLRKF